MLRVAKRAEVETGGFGEDYGEGLGEGYEEVVEEEAEMMEEGFEFAPVATSTPLKRKVKVVVEMKKKEGRGGRFKRVLKEGLGRKK